MPSKMDLDDQAYLNSLKLQAMQLWRWLAIAMDEEQGGEVTMYQLTIQSPAHTGSDYRIVVKARGSNGEPLYTIVNGATPQEAIASLKSRNDAGALKFREDKPFPQK